MRFVRVITGMLLLAIGIPALLAGGGLWLVARHADPGGTFAARFETLELHAELRASWVGPATWGLLAAGVLLVACAVLLLLRPPRPREVVFVVEPDQVPVLAGRLGVTSLSGLGVRDPRPGGSVPTARQLAPVGSGASEWSRSAIGAAPARPTPED